MIAPENENTALKAELVRYHGIIEDFLYALSDVGTKVTIPGNVRLLGHVARENKIAEIRIDAGRELGAFILTNYGMIGKGTAENMDLVEEYKVWVFNPFSTNPPIDLDALMEEFEIKREAGDSVSGKII